MLLDFHATFNLHRDVMPWILAQGAPVSENTERSSRTLRIVNVEQDGSVLYTWKGTGGFTSIGLYDPHSMQNKLLYSFDQDLYIISCSVNCEKTLLALSYCRSPGENKYEPIWSVSRYLALLIEIQPINNVRVLKVVDSSMKVQFLYPTEEMCRFPESHLLVVSEERYIEQYHICVATEEEGRVVINNSGQLPKDRITEDFVWAQWDASEQRLYYIVPKRSSCVLHCVQFYPEDHYKNVFEVSLEIILSDQVISFVNLGIDVLEERGRSKLKSPNLQVFTNNMGGLCLIYVQPSQVAHEVNYMVVFLHKGCSKTFKVQTAMEHSTLLKNVSFINLDSYIAVYLPDQFLHLINTRHPDLMCYHLFLAGDNARIPGMCCDCPVQYVLKSCVLEYCTGILYSVRINQSQLVKLLSLARLDADKLAILHCVLLNLNYQPHLETQLIEWICENLSTCQSFDPIQEFITASLYRKFSSEAVYLDKLLPYTSVPLWNEDIDGVSCTTDITDMPVVKVEILKGFWEKFHSELEYMKVAQLRFRYANYIHRRDWCKLINEVDTKEKRNGVYQRSVLENVKKVLLNMETWRSDQRTVPLYQEEEYQHKELMGLMVIKLKDHLSQYLHIGKSKIDKIVLDYVSRQLDIVCLILEVVWRKCNMESCVFNFNGRGSSTEYFAFHVMCRVSEAASRMCMPLPPGFHTLQLVLGVRCLPLGNFLHCIDSGVLHLTENFVVKLLKELDDDGHNEKIKYSIIIRLPEAIIEKVHHLWDHAISNKVIGMKYVKQQLCNLKKKELTRQPVLNRSTLYINFLPLNYLIMMLSEVEETALNPFEDDNIDATFLEEIALKQTAIALRLQKR